MHTTTLREDYQRFSSVLPLNILRKIFTQTYPWVWCEYAFNKLSPPRPPRFPLGPPLALGLRRVLIAPHPNLPPPHRLRVIRAVRALGLAFEEGGGALLGAEGFRGAVRQVAGDGLFGAADGHFVEGVLAEIGAFRAGFRQGDGAVGAGAHVVDMGFGEIAALAFRGARLVSARGGDAGLGVAVGFGSSGQARG